MEAIKSAINSVLHHGSTSTDSTSGTADPHTTQTPAQQVKQEQQLTEATRDLSLEDKSTQGASADTSTNALSDRKQQESRQAAGVPSVQEEVQAVTSDADREAIQVHDRLLADIEQKVPEVPAVTQEGAGADPAASIKALAPTEALAQGQSGDVPRIAEELQAAAPEADPRAIQTHSLLVSEVEAVVGGEEGKPVHKILSAVERPETPAELNAAGSSSRAPGSTPSVEHTANPFESQSAGRV